MPDATEWLVESRDQDGEPAYAHCETLDVVQAHVRKLFDDGFREVYVYQRVPFEVKVDVTVRAPRKRKRKEAGAASPDAQEGHTSDSPEGESGGLPTTGPVPASPVLLIHSGKEEESPVEGADRRPAPSRVSVWECEVDRYDGDGPCAGPILYDPFSHGRFCEPHMTAAPSGRAEWHRRNKDRNAPAAEAVG